MEKIEYISLYDYLGRAAGGELGKQVALSAKQMRTGFQIKEVSNKAYKGKILMYPRHFLDLYFKDQKYIKPKF